MAISFNSIGHFFAKAFTAIKNDVPKVVSAVESGIVQVEGTESTVETVTSVIPGGSSVVPIEKAAYAVLGEIASLLSAGDAAAKAKLADAGLDSAVVEKVEAVLASVPNLVALAKAL